MHSPSSTTRQARAFTLIELLVVVGIIIGLVAILLPIFSTHDGSSGRRAICQSNLKQISLGFRQYIQDYNERYPVWQHKMGTNTGWAATIQPYLKDIQIYQCPTEINGPTDIPGDSGYCDYFYNSNLGPPTGGRGDSEIEDSTLTIMLGDSAPFSASNASNGGTITKTGSPSIDGSQSGVAVAQGQWAPTVAGQRHVGGANYVFVDCHVKWLGPSRVTRNPTSAYKPTFRWSAKNPPVSGS
jgi:prepilin-type processing-associated H-X9-DG protein